MMLLYICETCGWHTDASISQSLKNMFASIPNQAKQPSGIACQYGCGMMRQVLPDDKLCIVEDIHKDSVGMAQIWIGDKRYRAELYEIKEQG